MLVHEQQAQTNWCWVACFRMACSQFGVDAAEACTIAQQFLGVSGCCPAGSNCEKCNGTLPDTRIPALYASESLTASSMPVSDSAFQQALAAGALVLVMIAFPESYHYVLLSAYQSGTYTLDDPRYSMPVPASFADLQSYPQGALDKAWLLRPLTDTAGRRGAGRAR